MQRSPLEYRPDETVAQVDFTGDTVAELEPEHMIANVPHHDDPYELEQVVAAGSSLRQRRGTHILDRPA